MMTEDDLTALNDGLIGAVYIEAKQVRMDTVHATSLIAMALDSLDLRAQLAAMTAERDALVGAVIEQAIWQVRSSVPGHMMVCDTERICDSIRALTSADATTALDHIRAQAKAEGRKEGMREVRSEVATRRTLLNRQMEALDISREDAIYGICDAILSALLPEGGA